jgi:hypothetical protein
MDNVTELQRRILVTAMVAGGRLIFWVLPGGRYSIPGFAEDAADAVRTLRGAGLVTVSTSDAAARSELAPGSHILRLSEAGSTAAKSSVRRA